jgi:hypothetical protein
LGSVDGASWLFFDDESYVLVVVLLEAAADKAAKARPRAR